MALLFARDLIVRFISYALEIGYDVRATCGSCVKADPIHRFGVDKKPRWIHLQSLSVVHAIEDKPQTWLCSGIRAQILKI